LQLQITQTRYSLQHAQVVHGLLCMSALPSVQNTERVANLCMVICIITVTVFVQSLKSYCIHIEDGHLLFWTDLNNFSNKNFDVLNLVIFVLTCCREYLVCDGRVTTVIMSNTVQLTFSCLFFYQCFILLSEICIILYWIRQFSFFIYFFNLRSITVQS
jgi:hypothetical protein